jgi:O-antigen/teichoic acid export membrane protein
VPALLIWHIDAHAVLGIWAAMYLLGGAYALSRISRAVPSPLERGTTREVLLEQALFTLKSGSLSVAGFLNLRVDVFVVGLMLDTRTLGIYSLAVATAELLWQLSRPLGWTTLGRIAAAERSVAIALTATVARNVLAVEAVAGAVLFAIAPAAIAFVYGTSYTESGYVLRWLIPGVVVYAASGTLGYYVMVKEGKPLTIFFIQAGSVVACAALTASTLHVIGIFGAALATSVTYGLSAIAKAIAFTSTTGTSPLSILILRKEDAERYRRIVDRVFGVCRRAMALASSGRAGAVNPHR